MNKKKFDIEKHEHEILEQFEKGEFVSNANRNKEIELAKKLNFPV